MINVIADSNIAHLADYFNADQLGTPINLLAMSGRDMTADIINQHQPDALLIRSVTPINRALLAHNNSVKYVGSATIGTDHVNLPYLAERGIAFQNAAGCSKHSVAQYVLTAILSLRKEYWHTRITLGIIGLGNIGMTLAQYALDLGWHVLGYDPFLPSSPINNASLDDVLTQSNVISLHVPLTTASTSQYPTHHLIDASAFAKMAADTMLINSARGPIVSESALLADVQQTQRHSVLDVFEYEPSVSADLLKQVTLATPHIAGYTLEGKLRGTQIIFAGFVQTFAKQLTVNEPNLLQRLLPYNPYQWQHLKQTPDSLTDYYDINADDALLRQALDTKRQQVAGSDFDALRKHYPLRREWLSEHLFGNTIASVSNSA